MLLSLILLCGTLGLSWASPMETMGPHPTLSGPLARAKPELLEASRSELGEVTSEPLSIKEWSHCADGWHLYNGNCYKWSGVGRSENWFSAQLDCRRQNGHLVSIADADESKILRGITSCSNVYWLGLVNTEYTNGNFVKKEGWSWWDDKVDHNNYTRLSIGNTAGLDCAFAKADGNWQNSYCSHTKRTWVCKRSANFDINSPHPTDWDHRRHTTCPSDWVSYNGNCYWFSNTTVNYFHAQLHCHNKRASVVTIHSEDEQAFLQAVNGCDTGFWVGLERALPCVSKSGDKCWEWTDLSQGTYRNWFAKNPVDNANECTASKGYWKNDMLCSQKQRFVCKRRA